MVFNLWSVTTNKTIIYCYKIGSQGTQTLSSWSKSGLQPACWENVKCKMQHTLKNASGNGPLTAKKNVVSLKREFPLPFNRTFLLARILNFFSPFFQVCSVKKVKLKTWGKTMRKKFVLMLNFYHFLDSLHLRPYLYNNLPWKSLYESSNFFT